MHSAKDLRGVNEMRYKFLVILLAACLAGGCNWPQKAMMLAETGPQAWIDVPLDGSSLPVDQPYEIVFHNSDLSGVILGELSINGQVLQMLTNPDPKQTLANHRVPWTPTEPGNYTIRVRTQNGAGQWSDYFEVVVTVGGPSETPTLTPTQTLTVTPTSTSPAALQTTLTFSVSSSTNQFYYGGCAPDQVSVAASVSPADNVHDLLLFSRLQDASSGEWTEWSNDEMNSSGGGNFSRTVSGNSVPERERYSSAFWQYQLVATNNAGEVIGRSQTYSNVTLSKCGDAGQPPQVITTTVAPKRVVPPMIKIITITPFTPPIIK
jgi:hypothetical protein